MQGPKVTNVSAGIRKPQVQPTDSQMVIDEPEFEEAKSAPVASTVAQSSSTSTSSSPSQSTSSIIDPIARLRADLEKLMIAGKIEEEFIVYNFKIVLATLSAKENTEVLQAVAGIEDVDVKVSTMRYHLLARTIKAINGIPLETLYRGGDAESIFEKKIEVISSWQQTFVNAIFEKYDDIIDRSVKANTEENSLKN